MESHIITIATMLQENQETVPLGVMCVIAVVVIVVSTIITELEKKKSHEIFREEYEKTADQETVLQEMNNEHKEGRRQV